MEVCTLIGSRSDDYYYDNVGCYGSEHFKTPRLDEFARTGIKFNHSYSEPVCTSSRVKIMTPKISLKTIFISACLSLTISDYEATPSTVHQRAWRTKEKGNQNA